MTIGPTPGTVIVVGGDGALVRVGTLGLTGH